MASSESELEELFHLAALEPKEKRQAFLEERCDDEEVREKVMRLLAQDDAGTWTLLREGARPGEGVRGERIDRYTIVKVLGQGGMGTVYLANQEEPVRRDVALKTIRKTIPSEDVLARFAAERQALAMMSHPGIAKVFDGGRTEEGLPYFVMEYVPGESLAAYTARHRLTKRAFLDLFREICAAVQHAHQKGIIHRDLKPGNILIIEREGKPFPKIIDFGIARSLTGSLTGDDQLTRGQVLGTFKYMSPEQADPQKGVDTRADIYALGVVLYEWLAGEPPFAMEELESSSPGEAWRVLLEEDPPTPSARFAALRGDRALAIAEHRHSNPNDWARELTGDLDWIVMKALEKERADRYASSSELSADLERHLQDLPVSVGPPTGMYRVRKFVRRHRAAVIGTALVALSLLIGLVASLWSYGRVREERDRAESELAEARYQAEKAEAFIDYFDDALSHTAPGTNLSLFERLERSSARTHDLFVDRPEAEAAVRFTLAECYRLLGEDDHALREFQQAYRLQESALDTEPEHFDLMRTLMRLIETSRRVGKTEEAEAYVRISLEKSRRILEALPQLEEELAALFAAAAGQSAAGSGGAQIELDALERVCAEVSRQGGAVAKALLRLSVEAVLNGSVGRHGVEVLTPAVQTRIRSGSARRLVLDQQIVEIFLQPRFLDVDVALDTAKALEDEAGRTYTSDHWLALDARRLRGLAHAERWRAERDPAELARAEELVREASDRAMRIGYLEGRMSFQLKKISTAWSSLCRQLGDEEVLHSWLASSWERWHAQAEPRPSWWPCSQAELPAFVHEAAAQIAMGHDDTPSRRQYGYALARRGLYDKSLRAFEEARGRSSDGSESDEKEDALTAAFRTLCLQKLGRDTEARSLYDELKKNSSERESAEFLGLLNELDENFAMR